MVKQIQSAVFVRIDTLTQPVEQKEGSRRTVLGIQFHRFAKARQWHFALLCVLAFCGRLAADVFALVGQRRLTRQPGVIPAEVSAAWHDVLMQLTGGPMAQTTSPSDIRNGGDAGERRKVCLVVTSLLIVTFFLIPLMAALSRRYDVTLMVNVDDKDFLKSLDLPVTVIPISIERNVAPWRDIRALGQLIRQLRTHSFRLVHSISPKGGLLGMMAAWMTGVPVRMHTFQGEVWATRRGLWRTALRFMDRLRSGFATQLTVVSHSERQFLIDEGIISARKSVVLANGSICGIDRNRFHPDREAREAVRRELGIAATPF